MRAIFDIDGIPMPSYDQEIHWEPEGPPPDDSDELPSQVQD